MTNLSDKQRSFLEQNRAAAMITLRPDGKPHAVRVGVAIVDGKLWSSGTRSRVRTKHLRLDRRCTLFVFDSRWSALTLEGAVTILEGPEVPEQSLRLFETMQSGLDHRPPPGKVLWGGQEKTADEFRRIMVDEQRLIYEFDIDRAYGLL